MCVNASSEASAVGRVRHGWHGRRLAFRRPEYIFVCGVRPPSTNAVARFWGALRAMVRLLFARSLDVGKCDLISPLKRRVAKCWGSSETGLTPQNTSSSLLPYRLPYNRRSSVRSQANALPVGGTRPTTFGRHQPSACNFFRRTKQSGGSMRL